MKDDWRIVCWNPEAVLPFKACEWGHHSVLTTTEIPISQVCIFCCEWDKHWYSAEQTESAVRLIKGLLATQTEENRVGIKCITSSFAPLLIVLSHPPQNLSSGQLGVCFFLKAEAVPEPRCSQAGGILSFPALANSRHFRHICFCVDHLPSLNNLYPSFGITYIISIDSNHNYSQLLLCTLRQFFPETALILLCCDSAIKKGSPGCSKLSVPKAVL